MTPWWLRPTAEGNKEQKDRPAEKAAEKAPESRPAPETPTTVAPESVALTQESLKEKSPSLESEPAWRHEPVPEPESPYYREEPEPTRFARAEPISAIPADDELEEDDDDEMTAEITEESDLDDDDTEDDEDDDEEEEIAVRAENDDDGLGAGADTADDANGAKTTETTEEARGESRRRRSRRGRGRGRKEEKPAVSAVATSVTSSTSLDTEAEPGQEDEEPVREAPVRHSVAARRSAPTALAPQMAQPTQPAQMASIGSPRALRESFTVPTGDLENFTREIIITMPERQRVADERKIAMFCDFENIALGVRDSDIGKFDIELILERLLEKGKIIVKKAYADWERYSDYKRPFHEAAIELIDIPQKYYSGKNSADIKMVVDAMDLSYSKEHLDTFVILSGDSDFSPLVSKLKENNKYVIGIGVKNSSSSLLIDNCDEFLYYEDVWRDSQQGPKLDGLNKKTAEVFSLMVDAIQALIRENKGVLWGSMIKQTMQRKKPSFNEGYYGYASFSELLEDAERKSIIRLKKDQRSGTYIVTGFATGRDTVANGRR